MGDAAREPRGLRSPVATAAPPLRRSPCLPGRRERAAAADAGAGVAPTEPSRSPIERHASERGTSRVKSRRAVGSGARRSRAPPPLHGATRALASPQRAAERAEAARLARVRCGRPGDDSEAFSVRSKLLQDNARESPCARAAPPAGAAQPAGAHARRPGRRRFFGGRCSDRDRRPHARARQPAEHRDAGARRLQARRPRKRPAAVPRRSRRRQPVRARPDAALHRSQPQRCGRC